MMIVTDEQVKQDWYDNLTKQYDERVIAFAHYDAGSLGFADYAEAQNNLASENYLVLTDEEADKAVRDYIEESVWTFHSSFLQKHTKIPIETIEKIQEMCEKANEPLKAIIKDFDAFVEEASTPLPEKFTTTGRGHFLASYDHEENKITFNGITYYIYRRN
jgi:hypothetical protein